jgi:hypothetical protein
MHRSFVRGMLEGVGSQQAWNRGWVAWAGAALSASAAGACPLCESETAHQVRAGLFTDGLLANLAGLFLPVLVLGLLVWAYNRGLDTAAAARLGRMARRRGRAARARATR